MVLRDRKYGVFVLGAVKELLHGKGLEGLLSHDFNDQGHDFDF